MESMTSTQITVQTTVNAPLKKVWASWSEPKHITKWCQASSDWHAPYAENDVRSGGKFKTTMAAKDGSVSFDFAGTYTRVEPNSLMEYTIEDGRRVRILFEAIGDKTKVTETFEAEGENSIEMQRGGWQAILDNFKSYTETL
jgi:uncharacterized protein YndB with AHSA1/START domain